MIDHDILIPARTFVVSATQDNSAQGTAAIAKPDTPVKLRAGVIAPKVTSTVHLPDISSLRQPNATTTSS